jgi:hypothetical protein
MADDLSWIDHPANLRANAALLRAIAEQSLLHADEIMRLTEANKMLEAAMPTAEAVHRLDEIKRKAADEIERLNGLVARQEGLIERLRAALGEKP